MADGIDIGRVQGASVFYTSQSSTSTSTTSITLSTLTPTDISPMVGDKILNSNGLLFNVTAVGSSSATVSYITSIKGTTGDKGDKGDKGDDGKDATLNDAGSTTIPVYAKDGVLHEVFSDISGINIGVYNDVAIGDIYEDVAEIDTNAYLYEFTYDSGSIAYGVALDATGANSVAIGPRSYDYFGIIYEDEFIDLFIFNYRTVATGASSTALGYGASATADYSTALGRGASATADYSTALGRGASAKGASSTALGYNASAEGASSTALGRAAVASEDNTIVFGNASYTSAIYAPVEISVTSDVRDKIDIQLFNDDVCYDFITSLDTFTYRRNNRSFYENVESDTDECDNTYHKMYGLGKYDVDAHEHGEKAGSRRRAGLSAQNVQEQMIKFFGTDDAVNLVNDNLHDRRLLGENIPDDVESQLTMTYANFIPLLISAIKAQKAEICALKQLLTK